MIRPRQYLLLLLTALLLLPASGIAASEVPAPTDAADPVLPPDRAAATQMETIVVSGEQPGPGLWRVTHGEHELWILGTLAPLPKRMQWRSKEVERIISQSQQVLLAPRAQINAGVGPIRGLFMLPKLLGARKNPDGARLQDHVSASQYERWLVLKRKYLGSRRAVEKRRPILAAQELYEAAIKDSGMSLKSVVGPVVKRAAKKHKVPMTQPEIELKIEDAKAMLNEFSETPLDDVPCFDRTLDRLEIEVSTSRERANAWATGDMETLAALPANDQIRTCIDAVLSNAVFKSRGFDQLPQRLQAEWLAAAELALENNAVTFALLPMSRALGADGYVAALRQRGYEVEDP